MKIYALLEVDTFDHLGLKASVVGYYANKDLALLAAQDRYNEIKGISYTFDEWWERDCHLDEITVVTENEE